MLGITFMIGRKLIILQNTQTLRAENNDLYDTEHLEEWKNAVLQNIKISGYKILVGTIRLYVRTTNFFKKTYEEIKTNLKNRRERKLEKEGVEKTEVSGFLKMISEYKRKIRRINRQIKEEEEGL